MSQDEDLGDAPEPPQVQIQRSNRQREQSIRYPSNDYVTLTDEGEPECYLKVMRVKKRKSGWMQCKMK